MGVSHWRQSDWSDCVTLRIDRNTGQSVAELCPTTTPSPLWAQRRRPREHLFGTSCRLGVRCNTSSHSLNPNLNTSRRSLGCFFFSPSSPRICLMLRFLDSTPQPWSLTEWKRLVSAEGRGLIGFACGSTHARYVAKLSLTQLANVSSLC